ncbi:hypothetical protein BDW02DRAFT_596292 [Decorospora gaudefroyi]|uniref:Uncharacterized protein n=1 Tax=Decorospora gaudefroyi TaxID=184978 RepID=A0A6A5KN34_9PLEO|nr:hypothetical protein BDW02DRAFT_596292 [Decorospora gaudefroyi]
MQQCSSAHDDHVSALTTLTAKRRGINLDMQRRNCAGMRMLYVIVRARDKRQEAKRLEQQAGRRVVDMSAHRLFNAHFPAASNHSPPPTAMSPSAGVKRLPLIGPQQIYALALATPTRCAHVHRAPEESTRRGSSRPVSGPASPPAAPSASAGARGYTYDLDQLPHLAAVGA